MSAPSGATIGGTAAAAANLISGNYGEDVNIEATSCLVEGNLIGTDETGTTALPGHSSGIYVGGSGTTIGGTSAGAANLISGNTLDGVDIEATSCLVEGNLFGTNAAGTTALPNGGVGILVDASEATIGGTSPAAANLISGNRAFGVDILATSCLIEGNLIGTDKAGAAGLPNQLGIYIDSGSSEHNRRGVGGRRQPHLRQQGRRRGHPGHVVPDRGQPDRHGQGRRRRIAQSSWHLRGFQFGGRTRSVGLRWPPLISSLAIAVTASTSTANRAWSRGT